MKYFYLGENDQAYASWVLFDLVKAGPKHVRNPKLPPEMYQFFGPSPDGEMQMKPEYLPLCCPKCGRYDDDPVFDVGFRDPVRIRIKGDFSHTQDRVLVVSEKFLHAIRNARVRGYETKPIGKSGWHAFRATERVGFRTGVMRLVEPTCPECKRAKSTIGMFERVSQLSVPESSNTFFTTERGWPTMLWDRDTFATEDVVQALRAAEVKGGYFNRLWTDEEARMAKEKAKLGKKWKPPGSTVLL
jgi:hypothetical protein